MHTTPLLATTAATLLTLAPTPTAHATPAAAAATIPAILIAAVHTDDETTLSAYWTNKPGVRKIVLWLDATPGASNTTPLPNGNPNRWNPGEWKPAGNLTTDRSRSNGKFQGSLLNLTAMRKADPSIPALTYNKPTKQFTDAGRAVTTWIDPPRGGAIRYNLPAETATPQQTRAAINDVTRNPTKYGIPANTRWVDLVAPNYYNWSGTGGTTCDVYQQPTHKRVNMGVATYAYPQFSGLKFTAACKADPSARRVTRTLKPAMSAATHAKKGTLNTYFGWLYRGLGVPLTTTKSGVFATSQAAIWSYARNGL